MHTRSCYAGIVAGSYGSLGHGTRSQKNGKPSLAPRATLASVPWARSSPLARAVSRVAEVAFELAHATIGPASTLGLPTLPVELQKQASGSDSWGLVTCSASASNTRVNSGSSSLAADTQE